jgi:predicted ATPase
LSIPSEDYPLPKHLQGQELTNALHEAIAAINILNSKTRPMVAILEDWHWADPASDAALKHMISVMASHPFMLLVIYRPEYPSSWANWSHHSPIILQALDNRNSENIIKSVWSAEHLPAGIASKIHERTGGNPFFTEEISNALVEEGMVQVKENEAVLSQSLEHLMLPDTVQSVIRARLDRLDHFSRESLRLASVIGREFAQRILEQISSSKDQLSRSLEELKVLEMIQQIRVIPEAEYMFKHVITQEVTYETLLRQNRNELHGLVGKAFEELYQDRLEEQVSLLYRHFSLAENWPKAAEYGRRAANRAYRLGQFQEAVIMFDKAQSCLSRLPDNQTRQKNLIDLQLEMLWPLHFLGQQDRAYCSLWHSSFSYLIGEDYGIMARVNEVLEIAEKTDSPIIRYLCYAAKGNAFMAVEQMEAARNFYEKALQSIEGTEHRRYLEEVYHNLIETTMALGDLAAAEQFYQDLTPLLKLNPGKTAPRFDFLKGRLLTLADSPDYARADEFFQRSIHKDETSGAVVLAARTKYYRADMLARKEEIESGRSLLGEIQKQFQNWGIPAWQLKCLKLLNKSNRFG